MHRAASVGEGLIMSLVERGVKKEFWNMRLAYRRSFLWHVATIS